MWDYLGARIPESLLGISTIPASEGYKVTIIDQRVEPEWKEKLYSALKENPVVFCTTCMTGPQITFAVEVSKLVKEFNRNLPVVWGGLHPTSLPVQTLEHSNVDIAVIGDGEFTFPELVHAVEKGYDLSSVKGIGYKDKSGRIHINPAREEISNLDVLPDLPYHLVDVKKYYAVDFRGRPSISITTSKGCPYRCSFCIDPAVTKQRWRAYSADRVLKKMKFIIDEFGIKDFYFQDDNFGTSPSRVKELLKGIIREFDDVAWGTLGIRADAVYRMDEEYQDLLVKSGCRNIDMGIETGSPRMLELMKKDEPVDVFIKANEILAKLNITVKCTFVLGYPTETEEDIRLSKELALKIMQTNPNAYCVFFTFCPYVGTEAWDLAVKNGFEPPKTLEDWACFDFDGWYKKSPAWLDKRRQKIIDNINFTSYFINKNIKYKINNKVGKFLFDIYNPIANFRFKKDFYHFPVERKICNALLR